ncbi:unnamed protein product [Arctogadus glacialis]
MAALETMLKNESQEALCAWTTAQCSLPGSRNITWAWVLLGGRAEMALSAAVFTVELLREQARAQRPLLFRLWGQKFRAPKLFSLADL